LMIFMLQFKSNSPKFAKKRAHRIRRVPGD
jgi:hypothetical protein